MENNHLSDKQIREAFQSHNLDINKSELWADIQKDLPPQKKRKRYLIFWWTLPVLLSAGFGYYFRIQEPSSEQKIKIVTNSTSQISIEDTQDCLLDNKGQIEFEEKIVLESIDENNEKIILPRETTKYQTTSTPIINPRLKLATIKPVQPITIKPLPYNGILLHDFEPILVPTPEEPNEESKLGRKQLAFTVSTGIMIPQRRLSGDDGNFIALKQQKEHALTAYNSRVLVHLDLSNKISVGLGLDYQRLRERLDWERVTEVRTSQVASDSAFYYQFDDYRIYFSGTLNQTETDILRIRHHNSIERISIPISIQYQFIGGNKFGLNTNLGFQFNVLNRANGRFVGPNNEVVDIQNSSQFFRRQAVHSFNFGMGAEYHLGSKWSILGGVNYSGMLSNMYEDNVNVDYRYRLLSLNLGLRMNL